MPTPIEAFFGLSVKPRTDVGRHVRITTTTAPYGTKVYLDDTEVTNRVFGWRIEGSVNSITHLILDLIPETLEVDGETVVTQRVV